MLTSTTEPTDDIEASLAVFALFRKFPLELRCKIYRLSAPEGRIVTIKDASSFVTINGKPHWVDRVRAVYTVPSLFQICKESRMVAQKIYHSTFTQRLSHPVPFKFWLDTLLFDGPDGAATMFSFLNPPYVQDQAAADAELRLMHGHLRTLIVAGDDMYLYTSEDVAGFYNLRVLILPWKTAGNDDQLRAWMQGIWQRQLIEVKVELTKKLAAKEAKLRAAAELERARLEAEMEGMAEEERAEALRNADTKKHCLAIEEGLELQRLRKTKTEVIFTNHFGVETWLGHGTKITKPVVKVLKH